MDMVDGLFEHWTEEPPVEVLVAGYLGYKGPQKRKGTVDDLFKMFPGGMIKGAG